MSFLDSLDKQAKQIYDELKEVIEKDALRNLASYHPVPCKWCKLPTPRRLAHGCVYSDKLCKNVVCSRKFCKPPDDIIHMRHCDNFDKDGARCSRPVCASCAPVHKKALCSKCARKRKLRSRRKQKRLKSVK